MLRRGVPHSTQPARALALILLPLLPSAALAVGTWAGGEPPSADDYGLGGRAPWWVMPLGFVAILILSRFPMQTFAGVFVFIVGITAARWFGATAGWVAAISMAIYLWTIWFKSDDSPLKRDLSDAPEAPQDSERPDRPTHIEEAITKEGKQDRDAEPTSTPNFVQSHADKDIRRIAALRHRIDSEASRARSRETKDGRSAVHRGRR